MEKLSSKKIWYDVKKEHNAAQLLKSQERQLVQVFANQRQKLKNTTYNKRLERNKFKNLHKRYLSSIEYYQIKIL